MELGDIIGDGWDDVGAGDVQYRNLYIFYGEPDVLDEVPSSPHRWMRETRISENAFTTPNMDIGDFGLHVRGSLNEKTNRCLLIWLMNP